jgi:hypothetical protein
MLFKTAKRVGMKGRRGWRIEHTGRKRKYDPPSRALEEATVIAIFG